MSRWPKAEAFKAAEEWNAKYPVGQHVIYQAYGQWDGARVERTRTPARVLYNDLPAVWVTNHYGAAPIRQLIPVPESWQPWLPRPSRRGRDFFGVLLHESPGVTSDGLAVDHVKRLRLDTHTPDFAVLLFYVLEWQRNLSSILQTEGIEQLPDVLRLQKAVDVVFLLAYYTELFRQLGRRLEFANFDSLPRRRCLTVFNRCLLLGH
jgi:hypothetical protein